MHVGMTRRQALGVMTAGLGGLAAAPSPSCQLATYVAEVTPPLGHPLMGGGIAPARPARA